MQCMYKRCRVAQGDPERLSIIADVEDNARTPKSIAEILRNFTKTIKAYGFKLLEKFFRFPSSILKVDWKASCIGGLAIAL